MALYGQCLDCKKYVNLAKPILGSLHLCTKALEQQYMLDAQRNAKPNVYLKSINDAAKQFEGSKEQ